ncbi:MAG: hypothetical protein WCK90_01850 [archaeon]
MTLGIRARSGKRIYVGGNAGIGTSNVLLDEIVIEEKRSHGIPTKKRRRDTRITQYDGQGSYHSSRTGESVKFDWYALGFEHFNGNRLVRDIQQCVPCIVGNDEFVDKLRPELRRVILSYEKSKVR